MTKSIRSGLGARIGVAALGVSLLTAVGAGAATAATEDTIDVSVEIAPVDGPGALALTVAGDSAALTEATPAGTDRVFSGTLPTVTVTDTRSAEEVTESYWGVVGSISDFVGDADQPAIVSADAFGWYPEIVSGNEDEQLVSPGDDVPPGADDDGFKDVELLFINDDSAATVGGSYSANARLELRTPGTVAPGSYAATMTLSLFEG